MKILFISRGNPIIGISPTIINQGISLQKKDVSLDHYSIQGKGLIGYLLSIPKIRRIIKNEDYDLYHAHYSLSAFVSSLAGAKPLVVSLMGSDIYETNWQKLVVKVFNKFFWARCIVKSEHMKKASGLQHALIIPNGVNLNKFNHIRKSTAIEKTGWTEGKKHILFAGNPEKPEKNYSLVKKALDILNDPNIEIHHLNNVDHSLMPYLYNSADIIILCSHWEGSPNVIKEAMACGRPIVSTDVGDVKNIISKTKGCYLTSYEPQNVAEKIRMAIEYGKRTNGREQIKHLDENRIADIIISLYNEIVYGKQS